MAHSFAFPMDNTISHPLASSVQFPAPNRRQLFGILASFGVGSTVFQRALAIQAEQAGVVTPEMVQQADWIAGLKLSDNDRTALAGSFAKKECELGDRHSLDLPKQLPSAVSCKT